MGAAVLGFRRTLKRKQAEPAPANTYYAHIGPLVNNLQILAILDPGSVATLTRVVKALAKVALAAHSQL